MGLSDGSVDRIVGGFASAALGDPRRVKRVQQLTAKVARVPNASLPAALDDEAEIEGAYRLINNRRVTFGALVEAQARATVQRCLVARDILALHDTTDCGFSHLDPEEIGVLQTGKAGFRLHATLVLDANEWRRPLGIVYAETIHRQKRRRLRKGASGSETAVMKDREYERWWRGMKAAGDALTGCDRVIHIADREGDSYDLMARLIEDDQRFIIRVRNDRRARLASAKSDSWSTVKSVAASCEGLVEREVPLSGRKAKSAPVARKTHPPRKMRIAKLQFSATRVAIPRPNYVRDPAPAALELNLVHVIEIDPPTGERPVEWLLYTTEAIETGEQVAKVVDNYRSRWTIEEFNHALKTGCSYEARQFESRHALLVMLAVSLPIACEVLWLRSRARSTPNAPASDVLTALQIEILREVGRRKVPKNATANDVLFAVAGLGGHIKNNGDPGWKVLQRGRAALHAYEIGWLAAQRSLTRRAKSRPNL